MGALERMGFGRDARSQAAADVAPRAMIDQVQLGSLTDPGVGDFLRGAGGGESASGVMVSPEAALRTGTVFRCVTLIAGAVATLPLDLKRRVDARSRVDAEDHPVWTVLRRRPNGWQTPSQFRRYMQGCVLLRGRAFAQIVRGVGNRIIALHPLHPDRMEIVQSKSDLTLTFRYTRPDGTVVVFPQREILYLCGLTLDGVNGLSVLGYARESVGEAIATARHSASLFKNGTTIGGVITAKDKITAEGVEALRASLEAYRGADNAHKNLILQNGMTYDRLGLTLADAQFIQNREFSQYETCMFFGVPPHMLGLTAKATSFGAGLENMGRGFVAYTLQDWFTMWTEAIERDLTADRPDVYARFNTNALVRGDIKARYGAYAVGRQWGWLSANDVRAFEDEDAIEGGDVYLNPLNMKAADEAGQTLDPDPEDLNNAPEE